MQCLCLPDQSRRCWVIIFDFHKQAVRLIYIPSFCILNKRLHKFVLVWISSWSPVLGVNVETVSLKTRQRPSADVTNRLPLFGLIHQLMVSPLGVDMFKKSNILLKTREPNIMLKSRESNVWLKTTKSNILLQVREKSAPDVPNNTITKRLSSGKRGGDSCVARSFVASSPQSNHTSLWTDESWIHMEVRRAWCVLRLIDSCVRTFLGSRIDS